MKKSCLLSLLLVILSAIEVMASLPVDIKIMNIRHAYYRNENITFDAEFRNTGTASTGNLNISIGLPPLASLKKIIDLQGGESVRIKYEVSGSQLKPGEYRLKVTTGQGINTVEKMFDVYISQPPNPQRLSMYYWVPLNYWVPEKEDRLGGSIKLFDWGVAHGFNTFSVVFDNNLPPDKREEAAESMRPLFEKAIRERVNMGLEIGTNSPSLYKDHPEVFTVSRGRKPGMTQDNQRENDICLREPYVVKTAEKIVRSEMKVLGIYPSFYHTLINSEFQSNPCYSEDCIKRLKVETGLDLYNYPVNPLRPPRTGDEARKAGVPEKLVKAVPDHGIIEDDNPYYRYYMWWWKQGMGDALLNENISGIVKEYKHDIITWHDPFRLAPVYGGHKGLDCIGHWNYTHPDPKYTSYFETLITGARPEHQMIMPDITTYEYQNWLAPTDSGVIIIPPDILRENCWIALSGRPDIMCHYNSTSLNPLRKADNWHRDPKTFEMMAWMSENVYKPYGPMILQMERLPRKAAILSSASSVLFPEISRGGYPNTAIYPFYSLLLMAHIPADVIFDETIMRYGLEQYDILFLHQCETLTRGVYEKILEFKKHGGIVIGDKLLKADIPLDYRCQFDLDHRKRQLADLVLKGTGITADEDRELMIRHTDEIRKVLDGRTERYVDSDSPEVLLNVLKSGPVKYIFIINDKRVYGEKYGLKWKTFHEKGVEQTVKLKLKPETGNPVLYDLREHAVIPVKDEGGSLYFERKLGPCDGTIIAVYPNPVRSIQAGCPKSIKRGDNDIIIISVSDSEGKRYGSQPLHVTITDPSGNATDYSDYYATTNGIFSLYINPALNDQAGKWEVSVTDLTSGLNTSAKFEVR
jgi:hypothetical protein